MLAELWVVQGTVWPRLHRTSFRRTSSKIVHDTCSPLAWALGTSAAQDKSSLLIEQLPVVIVQLFRSRLSLMWMILQDGERPTRSPLDGEATVPSHTQATLSRSAADRLFFW